jgi:dolichyl-phosphate beta-glucosyltransferase
MFREAARIVPTLDHTIPALRAMPLHCELILVDDGSTDETVEVVTPHLTHEPVGGLRCVRLERHGVNLGKGAAVRTGLAAAQGRWRLIMDADNAAAVTESDKLLSAARADPRIGLVAGSRCLPDSQVEASPFRVLTGAMFKLALRAVGLRLLRDTQCGFKLYRHDLARAIAEHGVEERFAFDVEHLLLARRMGVQVREVGIRWKHVPGGRINPVIDGLRMVGRAVRIRRRVYPGLPDLSTPVVPSQVEIKPPQAVRA